MIDADLQHDETRLPKMLALLPSGEAELVVGSRYIEGGSADSFDKQRAGVSASCHRGRAGARSASRFPIP